MRGLGTTAGVVTVLAFLFGFDANGPGRAAARTATPDTVTSVTEGQADAVAQAPSVFTAEELRRLLAPFALYPDELLAQLLPACAYPIEIVQASRWIKKNETAVAAGKFSGADAQSWDPAVKALTRFPDVIAKLNEDLDVTSDIGDAFVNQPKDVADAIQALRQQAQKSGALKTTPQQVVTTQTKGDTRYVVIESAEPGVIYVPSYDANVVYGSGLSPVAAGLIGFGTGVIVGGVLDNAWDWGRGWVYPPPWPGYPDHHPPPPPGQRLPPGQRPPGVNGGGQARPWRPDPGRYQPGQGSKPGLAGTAGKRPDVSRPSGAAGLDRPARGDRPNIPGGTTPPRRDGAAVGRLDDAARPSTGKATQRPAQKPAAQPRPQPRTSGTNRSTSRPQPRPDAFSDIRAGGRAASYGQRGAVSRQSVSRPPMPRGGGGRGVRGGGRGR